MRLMPPRVTRATTTALEQVSERAGNLAALGDVADAERGEAAEQTEDDGEPLPVLSDAVFNIIHGAAVVDAVLVFNAVLHGEKNLGIFRDHAEEGGDPHPEDSTRAAGKDGAGDARNVSGADGAGQRRGHGLEGGDVGAVIFGILLLEERADGVFENPAEMGDLQPLDLDREVDAGADQQQKHQRTPGKAVERSVDALNGGNKIAHRVLSFSQNSIQTE